MEDDNFEETSLEPRLRSVARVLLILADAPQAAPTGGSASNGVYGSDHSDAYSAGVDALPEIQLGDVADLAHGAGLGESNGPPAIASDTGNEIPTITHPLYLLLLPSGHHVVWTTRDEWEMDVASARADKFSVIIVEGDAAPRRGDKNTSDGAVRVLRDLRKSPFTKSASVLAVVPPIRKGDKSRRVVEGLLNAGADDFFASNASSLEVESRVRTMAHLSQVRASLEGLRDQMRLQLQTDDLTKLLNRRFFFQAAHRECGRARRYKSDLSCLMIEIDHFKKLTSIAGWESGDLMLRTIAQILRDYTRDSDIVARFAEEKFVVLLPETEINGATMLREKIQAAVQDLDLNWQGRPLPISISVGEADRANDLSLQEEIDSPADDFDESEHIEGAPLSTREELAELLKAADAALFIAKKGVRLPTVFADMPSQPPAAERETFNNLPSISDDSY